MSDVDAIPGRVLEARAHLRSFLEIMGELRQANCQCWLHVIDAQRNEMIHDLHGAKVEFRCKQIATRSL